MRSILLIGLHLSFIGCAGLRQFPTDRLWEFDSQSQVCAEYKVVNFETMQYDWIRDVALQDCPSVFGFTADKIAPVQDWIMDAKAYARRHCQ